MQTTTQRPWWGDEAHPRTQHLQQASRGPAAAELNKVCFEHSTFCAHSMDFAAKGAQGSSRSSQGWWQRPTMSHTGSVPVHCGCRTGMLSGSLNQERPAPCCTRATWQPPATISSSGTTTVVAPMHGEGLQQCKANGSTPLYMQRCYTLPVKDALLHQHCRCRQQCCAPSRCCISTASCEAPLGLVVCPTTWQGTQNRYTQASYTP